MTTKGPNTQPAQALEQLLERFALHGPEKSPMGFNLWWFNLRPKNSKKGGLMIPLNRLEPHEEAVLEELKEQLQATRAEATPPSPAVPDEALSFFNLVWADKDGNAVTIPSSKGNCELAERFMQQACKRLASLPSEPLREALHTIMVKSQNQHGMSLLAEICKIAADALIANNKAKSAALSAPVPAPVNTPKQTNEKIDV